MNNMANKSKLTILRKFSFAFVALCFHFLSVNAFANDESSYTMADFYRVEKVDAHMHVHNPESDHFMKMLVKDQFKVLSINVDYADFPALSQQESVSINLRKKYPERYAFVASFLMQDFEKNNWLNNVLTRLKNLKENGAIGIKIWKNIGMSYQDSKGQLIMVDDVRLSPIFKFAIDEKMVIFGHQGEPKNCWLPLAEMTVENDRTYFKNHPQYHMYLHPDQPSYEKQISARDRMLELYPEMRFVGVHLASLEWSVDELAKFLDRFPLVKVDLSARMEQLQYQSNIDRKKVRQFFIQYQDRIMYGSDLAQSKAKNSRQFALETHRVWLKDWRYLNTQNSIQVSGISRAVQGLSLPKSVIDKLYRTNVMSHFPDAWHSNK